jgi:hypothetical protein
MRIEKLINTVYSFAAAVVIFGAWAKLEHKDFGSIALTIGLLTEVGIFFIYGLMEWKTSSRTDPNEKEHARKSTPIDPQNAEELTSTLKETNHLLNKVFRTE